jgi:hypothetical protein
VHLLTRCLGPSGSTATFVVFCLVLGCSSLLLLGVCCVLLSTCITVLRLACPALSSLISYAPPLF